MLKRRLLEKTLALLCALGLVLSLVPLYAMGFFSFACYDDYGFSILTHDAWRSTHSLWAVLQAAWQNTTGIRYTWEGTYTTSLISALQPAVFGDQMYFITTLLLLTAFLACLYSFLRRTLRPCLSRERFVILYAAFAVLMVNFLPDKRESFFWFNGGVAYTLMWSLMLLRWSVAIGFARQRRKGRGALQYGLLLLLSLAMGGAKYSTVLFALCTDALLLLWLFCKKHPRRWLMLPAFGLMLGGFFFSVTAPGNQVRAATLSGNLGVVKTLAEAFYFGAALIGSWFTPQLAAVWFIALWALRDSLRKTSFSFPRPVILTVLVFGLFCSQLVPTLYTGNYLGDGRVKNTYYFTYVLMGAGLLLYWYGWFLHRKPATAGISSRPAPSALTASSVKGVPLKAIAIVLMVLIVGCVGFKPEGCASYGPQNTTTGESVRSFLQGKPQQYKARMTERLKGLNDPDERDYVFDRERVEAPGVLMKDDLYNDNLDYVLYLYADYYQKDSVTWEGRE